MIEQKQEKYVSVSLDPKWFLGHCVEALVNGQTKVYINFYKNKNRTKDNEPNYVNKQGGLWIKNKVDKEAETINEEVIIN